MGGADGPDMPGVPVWQPRNKEVRRRAAPRSRALPRLTALLAALTSRGARPRQVQWAERYLELCQFRMHHGHCVVPRRFEGACGSLGSWVLSLRVQFKGARMQQRRLDLLRVPPPRPSPRTNRTRRVTHPVLIGHAASLSQVRRGAPAIMRELVVAAQLYAGLAGMQVAALLPCLRVCRHRCVCRGRCQ